MTVWEGLGTCRVLAQRVEYSDHSAQEWDCPEEDLNLHTIAGTRP